MPDFRQPLRLVDGSPRAVAAFDMHLSGRMKPRDHRERPYQIDRAKHDLDILEHVMGGVHTWPDVGKQVIDVNVNVRPWVSGQFVSAVEVEMLGSVGEE